MLLKKQIDGRIALSLLLVFLCGCQSRPLKLNPALASTQEITYPFNPCEEFPTTEHPFRWRRADYEGHEHTRVGVERRCYRGDGRVVQTRWCTQFCHKPLCDQFGRMNEKCEGWTFDANGDGVVDLRDFACIQNTADTNCCPHMMNNQGPVVCD